MVDRDWESLARGVGALTPAGELGSAEFAREAIARILGEEEIVGAVHAAMELRPGSELAESVLMLLKPRCAMAEYHRIFTESSDAEERRLAVGLLASISDRSVLGYLQEYLDDSDAIIQSWGGEILLRLVLAEEVTNEEAWEWVAKCKRHSNQDVQDIAMRIEEELRELGNWHND